jgi:large subunit ribosomal protein L21
MYAVVSSGGKQYRVEPGGTLIVERLTADAGATVTFDRVLLVGDGEAVTVGTPLVSGASVSATVLGEELGPKIIIFKFKQKVKYRRRTGHRQHLTRVRIDGITADGKTTSAPETEAKAPRARRAKAAAPTAKAPAKKAPAKKAPAKKAPGADEGHGTSRRGEVDRRGRYRQAHEGRCEAREPAKARREAAVTQGVADGTQEGRLIEQERSRQRRQAPRREARRRAAGAVRHDHRSTARQHLQPRRKRGDGA